MKENDDRIRLFNDLI